MAKRPPSGNGNTLHWQKGTHIWASGHFVVAKRPAYLAWGHFVVARRHPYLGMEILCRDKKAPIHGHGDILHCQKGTHIWAWRHFAETKRPPFMGMETLCIAKKAPIFGHGDSLHCQEGAHIWARGHFAAAKRHINFLIAEAHVGRPAESHQQQHQHEAQYECHNECANILCKEKLKDYQHHWWRSPNQERGA